MEGAKRSDLIVIRKQVTDEMMFAFHWRMTGATNQERLSTDIAKAAAFSVDVRHAIKATVILANIAVAAQFTSRGAEIRDAQ